MIPPPGTTAERLTQVMRRAIVNGLKDYIRCAQCSDDRRAICIGAYEDPENPALPACGVCCGHGNEDGWCVPIADALDALCDAAERGLEADQLDWAARKFQHRIVELEARVAALEAERDEARSDLTSFIEHHRATEETLAHRTAERDDARRFVERWADQRGLPPEYFAELKLYEAAKERAEAAEARLLQQAPVIEAARAFMEAKDRNSHFTTDGRSAITVLRDALKSLATPTPASAAEKE